MTRPPAPAPDEQTAKEVAAIRATSEAFVAAFNKGDAQAIAGMWTENGEYVDDAGQRVEGHAAIETGAYNLTKDEAPCLIHLGSERTERWLLVRLKQPDSADSAGTTQQQRVAVVVARHVHAWSIPGNRMADDNLRCLRGNTGETGFTA